MRVRSGLERNAVANTNDRPWFLAFYDTLHEVCARPLRLCAKRSRDDLKRDQCEETERQRERDNERGAGSMRSVVVELHRDLALGALVARQVIYRSVSFDNGESKCRRDEATTTKCWPRGARKWENASVHRPFSCSNSVFAR